METPQKFTQEIKDNWLKALKSGKYKQGFGTLYNKYDNSYCCYGVLTKILGKEDELEGVCSGTASMIVEAAVGYEIAKELWKTNDRAHDRENHPRDFSNVIPLIENLPVQN